MDKQQHTPEPKLSEREVQRFLGSRAVGHKNECWPWLGPFFAQGYGSFSVTTDGVERKFKAHRIAWKIAHPTEEMPECVCHTCDVPACCNPNHLWGGTRAENNADKEAKGRAVYPDQKSGEGNSNAVLTTAEVIALRVMARRGMSGVEIASLLQVSPATVSLIVNGHRRQEETEQRASACVNTCAGIETEILEANLAGTLNAEMRAQRDELAAALRNAMVWVDLHKDSIADAMREQARAALAKVK